MNERIEVWKVVSRVPGEDVLKSAILPPHLATTYRDEQGNMITAPSSMAFVDPRWAIIFLAQWIYQIPELQVWQAECDPNPVRIRRVAESVTIPGSIDFRGISHFDPNTISVEEWRRTVAILERRWPIMSKHIKVAPGKEVSFHSMVPPGAIRCTNLILTTQETFLK